MTDADEKIQEILDAFKPYDRIYKRGAVDEALALKEEITPHLIQVLEDTLANPAEHVDQMSHIYALILLGYFKETQAHKVIVDLFSLPEPVIDPLFGELITEDLPVMLFRTCGGSVDDIKRLILNKEAYEFCRSSAMDALVYAVIEGFISREEALAFFGSLFTGDEATPGSMFWSGAANSICELYPEEMMPVVEQAFQADLIDPTYIGLDFFEKTLEEGKEKAFERMRQEIQRRSPDNIHDYLSWWAMFQVEDGPSPAFSEPPPPPRKKSTVKEKAKKKKKRKMAKASKKKNRRR